MKTLASTLSLILGLQPLSAALATEIRREQSLPKHIEAMVAFLAGESSKEELLSMLKKATPEQLADLEPFIEAGIKELGIDEKDLDEIHKNCVSKKSDSKKCVLVGAKVDGRPRRGKPEDKKLNANKTAEKINTLGQSGAASLRTDGAVAAGEMADAGRVTDAVRALPGPDAAAAGRKAAPATTYPRPTIGKDSDLRLPAPPAPAIGQTHTTGADQSRPAQPAARPEAAPRAWNGAQGPEKNAASNAQLPSAKTLEGLVARAKGMKDGEAIEIPEANRTGWMKEGKLIKGTQDGKEGVWIKNGANSHFLADGLALHRGPAPEGSPEGAVLEIRVIQSADGGRVVERRLLGADGKPLGDGSRYQVKDIDGSTREVLGADGKRASLEQDGSALFKAGQRDKAAADMAASLVKAMGAPGRGKELTLARWVKDLSDPAKGTTSLHLSVNNDGQILAVYSRDGGKTFEAQTATFGYATPMESDKGLRVPALITARPAEFDARKGLMSKSPLRDTEYLLNSNQTRNDNSVKTRTWIDSSQTSDRGYMPWSGQTKRDVVILREGANTMSPTDEIKYDSGAQEIPETSLFAQGKKALYGTPYVGTPARVLGAVGNFPFQVAGDLGAMAKQSPAIAQGIIGAVNGNKRMQVNGIGGMTRFLGATPEQAERRYRNMTDEQKKFFRLEEMPLARKEQLKGVGGRERFVDGSEHDRFIYNPRIDPKEAGATLLARVGPGTYGNLFGEWADDSKGAARIGWGLASMGMHGGEMAAETIPTLLLLKGYGAVGATQVPTQAVGWAEKATKAGVLYARTTHAVGSAAMMAPMVTEAPSDVSHFVEAVANNQPSVAAERGAKAANHFLALGDMAKGLKESIKNGRANAEARHYLDQLKEFYSKDIEKMNASRTAPLSEVELWNTLLDLYTKDPSKPKLTRYESTTDKVAAAFDDFRQALNDSGRSRAINADPLEFARNMEALARRMNAGETPTPEEAHLLEQLKDQEFYEYLPENTGKPALTFRQKIAEINAARTANGIRPLAPSEVVSILGQLYYGQSHIDKAPTLTRLPTAPERLAAGLNGMKEKLKGMVNDLTHKDHQGAGWGEIAGKDAAGEVKAKGTYQHPDVTETGTDYYVTMNGKPVRVTVAAENGGLRELDTKLREFDADYRQHSGLHGQLNVRSYHGSGRLKSVRQLGGGSAAAGDVPVDAIFRGNLPDHMPLRDFRDMGRTIDQARLSGAVRALHEMGYFAGDNLLDAFSVNWKTGELVLAKPELLTKGGSRNLTELQKADLATANANSSAGSVQAGTQLLARQMRVLKTLEAAEPGSAGMQKALATLAPEDRSYFQNLSMERGMGRADAGLVLLRNRIGLNHRSLSRAAEKSPELAKEIDAMQVPDALKNPDKLIVRITRGRAPNEAQENEQAASNAAQGKSWKNRDPFLDESIGMDIRYLEETILTRANNGPNKGGIWLGPSHRPQDGGRQNQSAAETSLGVALPKEASLNTYVKVANQLISLYRGDFKTFHNPKDYVKGERRADREAGDWQWKARELIAPENYVNLGESKGGKGDRLGDGERNKGATADNELTKHQAGAGTILVPGNAHSRAAHVAMARNGDVYVDLPSNPRLVHRAQAAQNYAQNIVNLDGQLHATKKLLIRAPQSAAPGWAGNVVEEVLRLNPSLKDRIEVASPLKEGNGAKRDRLTKERAERKRIKAALKAVDLKDPELMPVYENVVQRYPGLRMPQFGKIVAGSKLIELSKPGEVLMRQGTEGTHAYIVLSGEEYLSIRRGAGDRIKPAVKGEDLGMLSLIKLPDGPTQPLRNADVTVKAAGIPRGAEPVLVLAVPKELAVSLLKPAMRVVPEAPAKPVPGRGL